MINLTKGIKDANSHAKNGNKALKTTKREFFSTNMQAQSKKKNSTFTFFSFVVDIFSSLLTKPITNIDKRNWLKKKQT